MLYDRAEIKGSARITKDGYFVADALVARANNIQDYLAHEIGLTDRGPKDIVRVFRPAEEVFHRDAMASLAHRPITLDHPSGSVTASNWKRLAVGDVGDEVVRDGEFIRVPIKIMDAEAIASVAEDRREFSLGYSLNLDMTPGEFEGHAYDAVAREFRYNHLAAVRAARGGTALRIIDERTYSDGDDPHKTVPARRETSIPGGGLRSTQDGEKIVATKTILIDGYQFEADAALEVAVTKLQGQLKDAIDGRAADKAAHDKLIATKDAEVDDLKTKVVDQAKIDQLADAKAAVVADAKQVAGDKLGDTAGKSVADVRRAACAAVLGDTAVADKSDDYIEARFDTLKDGKGEQPDPVRAALSTGVRSMVNDNGKSVRDLVRAAQF